MTNLLFFIAAIKVYLLIVLMEHMHGLEFDHTGFEKHHTHSMHSSSLHLTRGISVPGSE